MAVRPSVTVGSTQHAQQPDRDTTRLRPLSRTSRRGQFRIGSACYPIRPSPNVSMRCLVSSQAAIRITASASGDILFPVSASSIHEWTRS